MSTYIDPFQAVIPDQPDTLYVVEIGFDDYSAYGDGISCDFTVLELRTFYCETDAVMHAVETLVFHQPGAEAHITRYNNDAGGEKLYITQGDLGRVRVGNWSEDDTYEKYVTRDQSLAYRDEVLS